MSCLMLLQALKQLQQLKAQLNASSSLLSQQASMQSIHVTAEPSDGGQSSEESFGITKQQQDLSSATDSIVAQLSAKNQELATQVQELQLALQQAEAQQAALQQQHIDYVHQAHPDKLRALVISRGSDGSSNALFHSPGGSVLSDDAIAAHQAALRQHPSSTSATSWATALTHGPASIRSELLSARDHHSSGPSSTTDSRPASRQQHRDASRVQQQAIALHHGITCSEDDAPAAASPRAFMNEQLPSRLDNVHATPSMVLSDTDRGLPVAAVHRRGLSASAGPDADSRSSPTAYTSDAMQRVFSTSLSMKQQAAGSSSPANLINLDSPASSPAPAPAGAAQDGMGTMPTSAAELTRLFASTTMYTPGSSTSSPSRRATAESPSWATIAQQLRSLQDLQQALQQLEQQLQPGSSALLEALCADLDDVPSEELQQRIGSAEACNSASSSIGRLLRSACRSIKQALAARQPSGGDDDGTEGDAAGANPLPFSISSSSLGLPYEARAQTPLEVSWLMHTHVQASSEHLMPRCSIMVVLLTSTMLRALSAATVTAQHCGTDHHMCCNTQPSLCNCHAMTRGRRVPSTCMTHVFHLSSHLSSICTPRLLIMQRCAHAGVLPC